MYKVMTIVTSILMAAPAIADMQTDQKSPAAEKPMMKKKRKPLKACVAMRKTFSDEQKEMAKMNRMTFQEDTAKIRTRLQKTRQRYRKVIKDTSIAGERADKVASRRNRLAKRMRDARVALQHSLIYDIGTDEQRPKILKCLKARKKRQTRKRLMRLRGKKGKKMTAAQS